MSLSLQYCCHSPWFRLEVMPLTVPVKRRKIRKNPEPKTEDQMKKC